MVQREIRLVARRPLSPSVVALRFEVLDGDPLAFEPGQWANLNLPGRDPKDRRAYSIAGKFEGVAGAGVEFAVTHVAGGCLSPGLHSLSVGQDACFEGPFGFFTRADAQLTAPTLFVGTGSGIAPLRAMIHRALGDSEVCEVPLALLFGCRAEQDILYRTEVETLVREHPGFKAVVSLSRPSDEWQGLTGYVQNHLHALLAERTYRHVYVCGLSNMVREVRVVLKTLGFGRGTIHSERFD